MFFNMPRDCSYLEADEAKTMMQGVGSRFDFHMHKTLCDLRYVIAHSRGRINHLRCSTREIFDIIVDFPDSVGALQDLKVASFAHAS